MSKPAAAQRFLDSDEAVTLREELLKMVDDPCFNTNSTYTTDSSDRLLFVDKHMNYMSKYSNINPRQYLSNLKMKTRISP